MNDYMIWSNDITNRHSPESLTYAEDGDGYIATAVISGTTTTSRWKMSLWDAYKDLREKLLEGNDALLPTTTTTQMAALGEMDTGTFMHNITDGSLGLYGASGMVSIGGSTAMSASAFGEMVEDNSAGSNIDVTTKLWATASVGEVDSNGIITFSDESGGDKLVIGSGGEGTYLLHFSCTFTNAGGNVTSAGIHKNGEEVGKLEDSHSGDSSQQRDLRGQGFLVVEEGDEITLHVVSAAPVDVVSVYHCHVTMNRLS